MPKLRVFQLARELSRSDAEIILALQHMGVPVTSHSNTVEDRLADRLRKEFGVTKANLSEHLTAVPSDQGGMPEGIKESPGAMLNPSSVPTPKQSMDEKIRLLQEKFGKTQTKTTERELDAPPISPITELRTSDRILSASGLAINSKLRDTSDVFVSYSRADEVFVLNLCQKLKESGVNLWVDKWNIPKGADWDREIDSALEKSSKLLVILSEFSINSDQVRSEWHTALEENKQVIPVIYRKCKIPRRLRLIQHLDFTQSDAAGESLVAELTQILLMDARTKENP